jgi:hypothetical protein
VLQLACSLFVVRCSTSTIETMTIDNRNEIRINRRCNTNRIRSVARETWETIFTEIFDVLGIGQMNTSQINRTMETMQSRQTRTREYDSTRTQEYEITVAGSTVAASIVLALVNCEHCLDCSSTSVSTFAYLSVQKNMFFTVSVMFLC